MAQMSHHQDTIQILTDILQLGDRGMAMTAETKLLGNIPEFDSMAVVSVITAIEEKYGIVINDDEISAEIFESVGSLAEFTRNQFD